MFLKELFLLKKYKTNDTVPKLTAYNSTNHDTRALIIDYRTRSMLPAAGMNKSFYCGGRQCVVCAHVKRHLCMI